MIEMLHSIKFESVTMVTLTYGREYPKEVKEWKANLKEWRRRFERLLGPKQSIWRLELQKRGAPHFHILIMDCPYIPITDIQNIWYSVTKTPISLQYGNGCDIQTVKGDGGKSLIMSYVAKYAAKLPEENPNIENGKLGRIWGYWNIDEPKPIKCVLFEREAEEVAQLVMGMWAKKYYTPDDLTHCTLLGEELGTGAFQTTVKRIVENVVAKRRYKKDNRVVFAT